MSRRARQKHPVGDLPNLRKPVKRSPKPQLKLPLKQLKLLWFLRAQLKQVLK